MNRRDLLKYIGAASAAITFGPALRGARKARAATPGLSAPKRLLVCVAGGGWDTTYSIDPKAQSATVDVPASSSIKTYGNLDIAYDTTKTVFPNVDTYFTKYGANTAVIRGISIASVAHSECMKRICTGTRNSTSADLGATVAHDLNNGLPLPYLILGTNAFSGPYAVSAGRVGTSNQILALLDPAQAYETQGVNMLTTTTAEDDAIRAFIAASASRERATRGANGYNRARIDDFLTAIDHGKLLQGHAIDFGHRGNTLTFQNQIDLAVKAISGGISQAVMLGITAPGVKWDTHTQNTVQGPSHDATFSGLTYLLDKMAATPTPAGTMLDDTIVVVVSEMGRTPKLNANQGKDHWPVTSALVIGAGAVKGNTVFGGTDPTTVSALPINYATGAVDTNAGKTLTYDSFIAGVLSLCGVDPSAHLPSSEVFNAFAA